MGKRKIKTPSVAEQVKAKARQKRGSSIQETISLIFIFNFFSFFVMCYIKI